MTQSVDIIVSWITLSVVLIIGQACDDNSMNCGMLAYDGYCDIRIHNMTSECPLSCGSSCLCSEFRWGNFGPDKTCQCGALARKGECEWKTTTKNRCKSTCAMRKEIVCGPPPTFSGVKAHTNSKKFHWLSSVRYVCKEGWQTKNTGVKHNGLRICSRTGEWITVPGHQDRKCVEKNPIKTEPPETTTQATTTAEVPTVPVIVLKQTTTEPPEETTQAATTAEASTCKDKYKNCRVRAAKGDCDFNILEMSKNCPLSCKASCLCPKFKRPGREADEICECASKSTLEMCKDDPGTKKQCQSSCDIRAKINCGTPPFLENTEKKILGVGWLSVVSYACAGNFTLMQGLTDKFDGRRMCTRSGTWEILKNMQNPICSEPNVKQTASIAGGAAAAVAAVGVLGTLGVVFRKKIMDKFGSFDKIKRFVKKLTRRSSDSPANEKTPIVSEKKKHSTCQPKEDPTKPDGEGFDDGPPPSIEAR